MNPTPKAVRILSDGIKTFLWYCLAALAIFALVVIAIMAISHHNSGSKQELARQSAIAQQTNTALPVVTNTQSQDHGINDKINYSAEGHVDQRCEVNKELTANLTDENGTRFTLITLNNMENKLTGPFSFSEYNDGLKAEMIKASKSVTVTRDKFDPQRIVVRFYNEDGPYYETNVK